MNDAEIRAVLYDAVRYALRRAQTDPEFRWHMLMTEAHERLIRAEAAHLGRPADDIRQERERDLQPEHGKRNSECSDNRDRVRELEQLLTAATPESRQMGAGVREVELHGKMIARAKELWRRAEWAESEGADEQAEQWEACAMVAEECAAMVLASARPTPDAPPLCNALEPTGAIGDDGGPARCSRKPHPEGTMHEGNGLDWYDEDAPAGPSGCSRKKKRSCAIDLPRSR